MSSDSKITLYEYNEATCYEINAFCLLIPGSNIFMIGRKIKCIQINQIIIDKNGAISDTNNIYAVAGIFDMDDKCEIMISHIPITVTSGMIIKVITKILIKFFLL